MKMNGLEKVLVNNPARTWMLKSLASRLVRRAGGTLADRAVLEIGCGQGAGTEILLRSCGASRVIAFDYDPEQLWRAKRRHARRGQSNALLFIGDAARLPFPDQTFDVVVEFAILHHVPEWPLALREIARVLKPGGIFLFEEFLRGFTASRISQAFVVHPPEGWFSSQQFCREMESAGLSTGARPYRVGQVWFAGTANRR